MMCRRTLYCIALSPTSCHKVVPAHRDSNAWFRSVRLHPTLFFAHLLPVHEHRTGLTRCEADASGAPARCAGALRLCERIAGAEDGPAVPRRLNGGSLTYCMGDSIGDACGFCCLAVLGGCLTECVSIRAC